MVSKTMCQRIGQVCGLVFGVTLILGVKPVQANVNNIKIYKEAFPGSKPQCIFCHVDKIPKKDDGMHDLSAYGTKIKESAEEITVESVTQVGAYENFSEQGSEAAAPEAQE